MDGIIFTDIMDQLGIFRSAGTYRLRTQLRQHNYNIKIIDFCSEFSVEELQQIVLKYCDTKTLFIGWSTTFFEKREGERLKSLYLDVNIIRQFHKWIKGKFPNIKIIIGGAKAINYDVPEADFYVLGFADIAITKILDNIKDDTKSLIISKKINNSNVINCTNDYPVNNLKNLTITWDKEDLIPSCACLPIEISRGCIFKCAFCYHPLNGKKKLDYLKHPDDLKKEFIENYEKFGVFKYNFMDDTFNDSVYKLQYMYKIIKSLPFKINFWCYLRLDLIYRFPEMLTLLKDIGLKRTFVGIETLNHKTGKLIGKGLHPDKIKETCFMLKKSIPDLDLHAGFIVGLPYENLDSIYSTQEWLESRECPISRWVWSPLSIPSTKSNHYDSNFSKFFKEWEYKIFEYDEGRIMWINQFFGIKKAVLVSQELMERNKRPTPATDFSLSWLDYSDNEIISEKQINMRKRTFIKKYKNLL